MNIYKLKFDLSYFAIFATDILTYNTRVAIFILHNDVRAQLL